MWFSLNIFIQHCLHLPDSQFMSHTCRHRNSCDCFLYFLCLLFFLVRFFRIFLFYLLWQKPTHTYEIYCVLCTLLIRNLFKENWGKYDRLFTYKYPINLYRVQWNEISCIGIVVPHHVILFHFFTRIQERIT